MPATITPPFRMAHSATNSTATVRAAPDNRDAFVTAEP
jgi:hypothetical protein